MKNLLKSKTFTVLAFIFLLLTIFFKPTDTEKVSPKEVSNSTISSNFTLTESQHNEIGESYASILSDRYSRFFEACNCTYDGKILLVEVNSRWLYLHKEDKVAFVKDIGSLYMGMLGARGFNLNPEDLRILVKHSGSGTELATWDYIFGTEIKE